MLVFACTSLLCSWLASTNTTGFALNCGSRWENSQEGAQQKRVRATSGDKMLRSRRTKGVVDEWREKSLFNCEG